MNKLLLLIWIILLSTNISWAQEKTSKNLVYGILSYGFETDWGNTGFLLGLGYQRNISKKFIFQAEIHNFRTGIINVNLQYEKYFPKEERFDNSAFLNASVGCAIIGKTNNFNITVKSGPSLCYINSKNMLTYQAIFYSKGNIIPNLDPGYIISSSNIPDGTEVVTPSSIRYKREHKYSLGYNFGIDVNIPIKKKHFFTIGFLSISQDSPGQYFFFPLPVFSYKLRL